ncbi:phenylacetate--CoA ligase family protein [Parafrankia elaeagni]|uniref:phenylacetate--CoA ligase family protein n=1 Tax=Parafrankia elaeagni TaxID=222534 RepID=UPI000381CDDC|nr:phenylacetate--CoA ligase family protein [Parafrankia elaeagni]
MWLPTSPKYRDFVEEYFDLHGRYVTGAVSDQELHDWSESQLRKVVALAKEGSTFYQKQLASIDARSLQLGDLQQLPFTTKEDLRNQMMNMLSRDLDEACFFYETTGTTGRATPCPRDAREVMASNAHVTESWRNIFAKHFPGRNPRVGLMGPTEVHSTGDTLGDIARNVESMVAKIWPYSPVMGFRRALELMHQLQLDVIFCTPNVAMTLAKAAYFYGFDPRKDFAVKVWLVTGELCTPALARQIDTAWDAKTYNALYGAQESLVIASACANGRLHLAAPNYVAELIDPDTAELLGSYGSGELVVTMLIEGAKPLIRYRTGDYVHIARNNCGCGIFGPLIEIAGRTLDRLAFGGRSWRAWDVEEAVLRGVESCLGYQVEIGRDEHGGDVLRVRLDVRQRPGQAAVQAHAARISEQLGVPAVVEHVDELDPVTTTGAFVSWKAARIKDTRHTDDNETKAAVAMAGKRGYRS